MSETVVLEIPAKAEYVLAARLTASAVAQRFSLSIDDLEDIKMAVGEALVLLIAQQQEAGNHPHRIQAGGRRLYRDADPGRRLRAKTLRSGTGGTIAGHHRRADGRAVYPGGLSGCVESIGFMKRVG